MFKGFTAITLFLGLSSSVAFANAQPISPSKDANGNLQFGVQFAPASKMVAITLSVKGNDLVGVSPATINPAQWAILSKLNGSMIAPWGVLTNSSALVDPSSDQAFTLAVPSSAAVAVSKSLRDAVLAIAIKDGSQNPSPTQLIDLSDLCAKAPEKFLNLDTFEQGCN